MTNRKPYEPPVLQELTFDDKTEVTPVEGHRRVPPSADQLLERGSASCDLCSHTFSPTGQLLILHIRLCCLLTTDGKCGHVHLLLCGGCVEKKLVTEETSSPHAVHRITGPEVTLLLPAHE